ncbi:hypothetical protein QTN25_006296 [Entamoeba marina]
MTEHSDKIETIKVVRTRSGQRTDDIYIIPKDIYDESKLTHKFYDYRKIFDDNYEAMYLLIRDVIVETYEESDRDDEHNWYTRKFIDPSWRDKAIKKLSEYGIIVNYDYCELRLKIFYTFDDYEVF